MITKSDLGLSSESTGVCKSISWNIYREPLFKIGALNFKRWLIKFIVYKTHERTKWSGCLADFLKNNYNAYN